MKKKMFIAGMSFLLALVLLATASFAWFTISTKPEVTMQVALYTDRALLLAPDNNGQPGEFSQYISLSDDFAGLAPLRPVSTADGINWFLPAYDTETGELAPVSEFILDNTLEHANVRVTDENGNRLTGDAYNAAERNGYYVYTDFWMKTEEEAARVRLSVPAACGSAADRQAGVTGEYGLLGEELDRAVYGTYVLGEPELDSSDPSDPKLAVRQQQPETAIRVGFLVYQNEETLETGSGSETLPFAVYEPNAGLRAGAAGMAMDYTVPDENGTVHNTKEAYVSGFDAQSTVLAGGNYVITQPIALGEDGKGTLGSIDPANLIVQTTSCWDPVETVTTLSGTRANGNTHPNSNDVAVFGQFIKTDERFALSDGADRNRAIPVEGAASEVQTDIAGSRVIVTLKKETPVRVRLFVWIEGQDVDCWNDIAAGTCRINLELAGESLTEIPEKEKITKGVLLGYGSYGSSSGSWFDERAAGINRYQVTGLEFTKSAPEEADAVWNAGETTGDESIMAYRVGTKVYIVIPEGADRIYLPEDSTGLFKYLTSCRSITGLSLLDTSDVTSMYCMFERCNALESLDLTGFDTSKVTDMRAFLSQCSSLRTLDVSGLDTSAVTSLRMFAYGCNKLEEADFSGFDTSNVTDMSAMLNNCKMLVSVNLSGWNTSNVTKMDEMFSGCFALKSLDLSGFDTSKVTTMEDMFYDNRALEQLDVSGFRTHNVKNMSHMFFFCKSLTELDVSGFDTGSVTDTDRMFEYCMGLRRIYSDSDWNISPVSEYMFSSCSALTGGNGTAYQSSQKSSAYARIDRNGAPGYFTAK